ncbi:MAG TPA: MoaD/ThiS family protein [Thermoplasmatales archaeon]|nr:MoaD/ThiS family protein [Thermoplasmatales archaeon]
MKVEVEMRGELKEIEMNDNFTGEDLLEKLNLSPDAVIIIVDGVPVPYKERINSDRIKIIQVASGG